MSPNSINSLLKRVSYTVAMMDTRVLCVIPGLPIIPLAGRGCGCGRRWVCRELVCTFMGVGTALIGGAQSHIIHRFSPYMVIGDTMYGEIQ